MKIVLSLVMLFSFSAFGATCDFEDKNLQSMKKDSNYELDFAVKIPFPPKILEIIEKYFGNFSEEKCQNSIVAAKIMKKQTREIYYAFYTNQTSCDGGNSYGIIVKEDDKTAAKPIATIEDLYIDCLK